ncbi:MAG: hypothetical protein ACI3XP_01290 [Eubacteriales bacterium]
MQGKRYLSALLAALLPSTILTSCAGGGYQDRHIHDAGQRHADHRAGNAG